MRVLTRVARPLLAGMFIWGGLEAAQRPEPKVKAADSVVPKLIEPLNVDVDTEMLVRGNGIAQAVAGAMLAFGWHPRIAATVLLGSLAPTTAAGHRFWELDGDDRTAQQAHFLKNAAMAGGLLLVIGGA